MALFTHFIEENICLFSKCVDRAINLKEVYFVNASLSVKYNKTFITASFV